MDIQLITILLAAGILLSVVLHVLQAYRGRQYQNTIKKLSASIERLEADMNALCSGTVGVGKRINKLESKSRLQAERQKRLEHQTPDLQSYGNAARLANKGADVDELVDHCGLSRGEAELIMFLNSQQQEQQTH